MDHWRDGLPGALLMGARHGLYCMGCCWGLMLALIALGMMNLVWMGLIALLIFVENVTPWGERIALLTGVALMITGVGIAFG
jgi:predicted metal-binding membrane protein